MTGGCLFLQWKVWMRGGYCRMVDGDVFCLKESWVGGRGVSGKVACGSMIVEDGSDSRNE